MTALLTLSLFARVFEQRFDLGAMQLDSLDEEPVEVAGEAEPDELGSSRRQWRSLLR